MVSRGRGQRAGLSRAAVVRAARELLAAGGIDAVSMRAVARSLEVSPNALYSHVEDKGDLLDLLLEDVLTQVPRPSAQASDPAAGIVDLLARTFDALAAAPGLVAIALQRQGSRSAAARELGDLMDTLLRRAGVRDDVTQVRGALIVHAIGFAAFATPAPVPGAHPPLDTPHVRELMLTSARWLLKGAAQA
ncbi:MAG: TetR/AcrR family transcriptional regulator [Dermatophilaceae bacterium]